jgi:hypothetical protein
MTSNNLPEEPPKKKTISEELYCETCAYSSVMGNCMNMNDYADVTIMIGAAIKVTSPNTIDCLNHFPRDGEDE